MTTSGQSDFYQDSDYAVAYAWTDILSQQLGSGRPSGQMMAAWQSAATELLSTEGARRRLRLELERSPVIADGPDEVEDELDRHRRTRKQTGDAAGGPA